MAKNSSRTGIPVTSVTVSGNHFAVSGKLTSARDTKRASLRWVNPGMAFGSITTTGTRFQRAASNTGPATKPPMEKTAAGRSRSSIREAVHTLNGSSASVTSVFRNPTRINPPISIHSMGKPSAGASFASRPRRVPMKRTA